jgi:hypothetical protein
MNINNLLDNSEDFEETGDTSSPESKYCSAITIDLESSC